MKVSKLLNTTHRGARALSGPDAAELESSSPCHHHLPSQRPTGRTAWFACWQRVMQNSKWVLMAHSCSGQRQADGRLGKGSTYRNWIAIVDLGTVGSCRQPAQQIWRWRKANPNGCAMQLVDILGRSLAKWACCVSVQRRAYMELQEAEGLLHTQDGGKLCDEV